MIIHSFDDKTEPIMKLSDFYGEQKFSADICLITFSKVIYETILSTFECEEIGRIKACCGDFPIYKFTYKGKAIAFYLSMIGSTMAGTFVEEANWIVGATKFVSFGSSGSLDKEKTTNKFVVPTEAYRDEGMSYHYAPPADYIKIKNSEFLSKFFDELNLPHVEGRIWTTDAFGRETVGQIALRKAEGCIAVEMEVAGLQAVCDFHGFDYYTFIVTGDVLTTESYDKSELHDANHKTDKLFIALELISKL